MMGIERDIEAQIEAIKIAYPGAQIKLTINCDFDCFLNAYCYADGECCCPDMPYELDGRLAVIGEWLDEKYPMKVKTNDK